MNELCIITKGNTKQLAKAMKKSGIDADILHYGIVYEMDCQSCRIRRHEDGKLYMSGGELDDPMDCHELIDGIPAGKYVYIKSDKEVTDPDAQFIVLMDMENDFDAALAAMIFLKKHGLDKPRTVRCLIGVDEDSLADGLSDIKALPWFDSIFASLFQERERDGFRSLFPMSRDIRYLQAEARMTNKEFADYFHTSIRNIENWRHNPAQLSDFIYDLFEYKLLKEGII